MIRVLFYRARGLWQDRAIRALTGSIYSHCELVAPGQGGPVFTTIAASKRDDNQVRVTQIDTRPPKGEPDRWDLLTYPGDPVDAWERAFALDGQPYDTVGAVLSATALARGRPGRWFCSELVAYAMRYAEPYEFSPGMLAATALKLPTGCGPEITDRSGL